MICVLTTEKFNKMLVFFSCEERVVIFHICTSLLTWPTCLLSTFLRQVETLLKLKAKALKVNIESPKYFEI